MSEAQDAEREVEDFFNEEIFGVKAPEEGSQLLPEEAPPEPKPLEVEPEPEPVASPEAEEEEAPPEEEAPAEPEEETEEEAAAEPELEPAAEEPDYLGWAKKKYGDELELEKIAKAAYEQERMIGRQAEENRRLTETYTQRELQARIEMLTTPGVLTAEEDAWIDEAMLSDPAGAADALLEAGRADLYGAFITRWLTQGEAEARQALAHRDKVISWASQPQPSEQESYTTALGQTFVSLGLDIEQHGPLILQKAEELGAQHPAVQGMMSIDNDVRRISTRALYDLVAAGRTSVQKAKSEDVVSARVQEEQLRQNAAGVNQGGPRVEQPKKSPFWEQFEQEIADRGWDGNRPVYGKE